MLFRDSIEHARRSPDAIFATVFKSGKPQTLTRRDVLGRAVAVIDALRAAGAEAGEIVPIVLEHSVWLYPSFIGAVLGGFVPSFLPAWNPRQDRALFAEGMETLFRRLEPCCVITSAESGVSIPQGPYRLIDVNDIVSADGSKVTQFLANQDDPDDGLAFLQHSSGTTGHKKGVMITHAQLREQVALYAHTIGMSSDDTVASWLPLYHDMGLITGFLMPAILGCPIVSLDAQEWVARPAFLLDVMEEYRATFAWLPNFAFHHIIRGDRSTRQRNLHAVKAIVNCSEPCRLETFTAFVNRYGASGIRAEKLQVSYAMAENVFAVTQTVSGVPVCSGKSARTHNWLSCGIPLPGVKLKIRARKGNLAADGEIGEIYINSTCLFDSYFGLPEISAERIRNGWYRTGDLGCIEDGELFVVGRADDLLIISGKNVLAHEIEDAIGTIPSIAPGRVLAFGAFDPKFGSQKLVVLAETTEIPTSTVELEDAVRRIVFSVTAISVNEVWFVERGFLVKSTSGKLSREASLRKWRAQAEVSLSEYTDP